MMETIWAAQSQRTIKQPPSISFKNKNNESTTKIKNQQFKRQNIKRQMIKKKQK